MIKTKIIIAIAALGLAFSSCRKCETCTPFLTTGGANDTQFAQSVVVCRKAEIDAYQSGTNFTDEQGHPIRFMCTDTI